ncbi:glycosyltransferase [Dechloromonas sp. ZS-1]|uniref:glycosyltransferase n=1 Tax=Dechloromonas sp. ZS-1 TaxID=3138067 RepID=UPI0031FE24B0
MPRLFIHAINVHQGGGAVLLCDLLRAIPPDVEAIVHVDARMQVPVDLPDHVYVEYVAATLCARFGAERRLAGMAGPDDRILCFGNLPPLFRLRGKAIVFLQNRYLVDVGASLGALPLKSRLRLWLERAWLRRCRHNASQYVVQTPSMQRLTENRLGLPVICAPFVPASDCGEASAGTEQQFDFLYVASGEPHKNHAALLDAWGLLADDGLFPSLALTLSPQAAPELCERIAQEVASRGLHVQNLGILPYDQLRALYGMSGALIYPSGFESFGLPLIEARQAGLPVLAPELDYVRDITDPDETFDPRSPLSIARAVKRHRQWGASIFVPGGAGVLLSHVLERNVQ